MARLLPIGCEYEHQFPLSRHAGPIAVTVFRYRVMGHVRIQGEGMAESIDPVSHRERTITQIWADPPDMYGQPVWRHRLDGIPPSPTYEEQKAAFGIETEEITPQSDIENNRNQLRSERGLRIMAA